MERDASLAHYKEQLRILVWSGFFNEADLSDYLEDTDYDEDAKPHKSALREYAVAEIAAKREAEADWPEETDWDRLNSAFGELTANGILALHNAGYTSSDAHADAWGIINTDSPGAWRGFAYYHGQDVERAVEGLSLFLGFDAIAEGIDAKRAIGEEIVATLRESGLEVQWNGDPEVRFQIDNLDWKKRTDPPEEGSDQDDDDEGSRTLFGFFRSILPR